MLFIFNIYPRSHSIKSLRKKYLEHVDKESFEPEEYKKFKILVQNVFIAYSNNLEHEDSCSQSQGNNNK
jgi:hypothetical protein